VFPSIPEKFLSFAEEGGRLLFPSKESAGKKGERGAGVTRPATNCSKKHSTPKGGGWRGLAVEGRNQSFALDRLGRETADLIMAAFQKKEKRFGSCVPRCTSVRFLRKEIIGCTKRGNPVAIFFTSGRGK